MLIRRDCADQLIRELIDPNPGLVEPWPAGVAEDAGDPPDPGAELLLLGGQPLLVRLAHGGAGEAQVDSVMQSYKKRLKRPD